MAKFEIGPKIKTAIGIATIIGAGVSAVVGAIGEQNKQKRFDELEKAVAELQKK